MNGGIGIELDSADMAATEEMIRDSERVRIIGILMTDSASIVSKKAIAKICGFELEECDGLQF